MTGAHNFFRRYTPVICDHPPAQKNVEDFIMGFIVELWNY